MANNVLLIDGNSIGHANNNGAKLTVGGKQVQAIFGFLKSLRTLMVAYEGWDVIVLWDGRSMWRREVNPEYKANREKQSPADQAKKEAYKAQVPVIQKALQFLGVRQIVNDIAEADDLAGALVPKLTARGSLVTLVTGDRDWLMLVREGVVWYDPIRDRRVNRTNFFEFTGYRTAEAFLDGKALQGDTSDNIKPVGGIGEKGAPEFLAEFGSVDKFFELCDKGAYVPKKKAHITLLTPEKRKLFQDNRKIMNLLDVPPFDTTKTRVIEPAFNKDVFVGLCQRLAFASILRNIGDFLAPFNPSRT